MEPRVRSAGCGRVCRLGLRRGCHRRQWRTVRAEAGLPHLDTNPYGLVPFTGGHLWAFKPFAKDGSIDFVPGAVTTTPLGITKLACAMSDSDLSVTLTTHDVPSRAVAVTSTPVGLPTESQTDD